LSNMTFTDTFGILFLAAIIYTVGIPLIFASLYGLLLMLFLILLFLYRLRIEEKMLIERFRDEYREYIKKPRK
jgi:protein-S-isoprenylcysteine O-methyltransferase Ste14